MKRLGGTTSPLSAGQDQKTSYLPLTLFNAEILGNGMDGVLGWPLLIAEVRKT